MNMLKEKKTGHLGNHLHLKDYSSNIQFSTCQDYQNYAEQIVFHHYGPFNKDNVLELSANPNWLILILVTGKFSNIVLPVFGVSTRDSFLL